MSKTYIGERYSPIAGGPWSGSLEYERLTIVTFDNKAFLSRKHVPVGIPTSNTDYWMIMFDTAITPTGVSWTDILNKPTSYPPEAHTQGWDTITGKPTEFTPAGHSQSIATINGLTTTLTDMQAEIDALKQSSGNVGSLAYARTVYRSTTSLGVGSGKTKITWNGFTRQLKLYPGLVVDLFNTNSRLTIGAPSGASFAAFISCGVYWGSSQQLSGTRKLSVEMSDPFSGETIAQQTGFTVTTNNAYQRPVVLADQYIGTVSAGDYFEAYFEGLTGDMLVDPSNGDFKSNYLTLKLYTV